MLKRKSKRVLSIVLAVAMIVGLFPIAAFADGGTTAVDSTVVENANTNVAQVGDKTCQTLAEAFSKASAGQTIKLIGDVQLSDQGCISVTKSVTLDLNGHEIKSNGPAFNLNADGVVFTIQDTGNTGSICSTKTDQCNLIEVPKGELIVEDGRLLNNWYVIYVSQSGKATIKGGTLTSTVASVLSTNGSAKGNDDYSGDAVMNVEGGTLTSEKDVTIYVPAGTLNVSGGDITGATAIYSKSGVVNITDGNIKSEAAKANFVHSGNGCAATGDAVVIEACGYPNGEPVVNISGGNFTSTNGAAVAYYRHGNNEAKEIKITGGTYSSDVSQFVPAGNKWDPSTDAVVIDEAKAVASVNGVGYTSLQEAINAAPAGGTITILKDIDLDGTGKGNTEGLLTITKDVTIIGNSHKITAKDGTVSVSGNNGPSMINVQSGAKVTINDLIINGGTNDTFTAGTKHGININQAGTVTLNDVSIQNNRWYAVMNNGSDLVLKGLTTSGNQWGINVDNKGGDANLIVNNAGIAEESSIVFDKGGIGKITATINGGSFRDVVMGKDANEKPITTIDSLRINGGTFKTAGIANAIDVEDYLAPGLVYNPYTGQVYKEPEYTGKYSYEIFTKVGDNGTISVDRYATEGDDVTITVSPDEAYLLDELTVTTGGKEVEVKDNGDGTYTFKMPSADAKIVVTFAEDPDWEPAPEMPFTDVNENDWFYDVVLYAYDNGLMTGVSATEFAPNQTTTRGMIVSMLARLEGVTNAEDAGFADVAENDWYATAVNWAASVGVVNGYEDNTFRPNAPITREQMAAILYNYADYKGYDVSARADLSDYADAASISSWAEDVLAWANAEGLINGMTATTIDPQGATTRAQTAAMFERFLTAHEA